MKLYTFPSIDQYRTVIKTVRDRCTKYNVDLPTLRFHGTVKLHGTNAAVIVNKDGTYYAQSRRGVITPEDDNMGFAAFAHGVEVMACLRRLAAVAEASYFSRDYVTPFDCHVGVYGEWCGGSIQPGVALNKLPKQFVVFAIRIIDLTVPEEEGTRSVWLMPWEIEQVFDGAATTDAHPSVKCVEKFQTWNVDVDFARPEEAQNELVRITTEVEAKCPFGAAHGVEGVGEGVVWTCIGARGETQLHHIGDLVFKVKGEKHSDTKVKTVAAVDIERVNSIRELAEAVTTEHRLEKAAAYLVETLHTEAVYSMKNIGPFLIWIYQDIVKEESDTIAGNGFEVKEVTKAVNDIAKAWFIERANAAVGLKAA